MTALCPNGHTSSADDYCDVCGAPMTQAAPAAPTPAPPDPPAGPNACPNCGSVAAPGALFCENCGYDFTTGALPEPLNPLDLAASPPPVDPPAEGGPPAGGSAGAPAEPSSSRTRSMAGPSSEGAEPGPTWPAPILMAPASDSSGQAPAGAGSFSPSEEPEAPPQPDERASAPTPPPGGPSSDLSGPPTLPGTPVAPAVGSSEETWVAELWIDPDWYADQQSEDPMPSAGPPGIVVLRGHAALVGRLSTSRNIHPQIDCGADTGVSRRHCQLTTDGLRWWVEDLQSANGTFVAAAGEPLPTDPIRPGQRRELEEGDRVYIGAWTRLVVRKALPGEA